MSTDDLTTEELLTELFAEQADHRPDPRTVLDDLHQRLPRYQHVTRTRAVSTLGAAAAVAAVAVGVTVLSTASDDRSAPAGPAHPAAPAHSSASSPASIPATASPDSASLQVTVRPPAPSSTAPGRPSIQEPPGSRGYSTIDAGYLPGPATQDPAGTSNQPGFEQRDWDVTVDGVAMDVVIWTETGTLPTRMQATGGKREYRAVTVNGHPGREFVSANVTIVAFDLGNGTIAYAGPSVQHTTDRVTTARISRIAVKVAQNMRFDRHDAIPSH